MGERVDTAFTTVTVIKCYTCTPYTMCVICFIRITRSPLKFTVPKKATGWELPLRGGGRQLPNNNKYIFDIYLKTHSFKCRSNCFNIIFRYSVYHLPFGIHLTRCYTESPASVTQNRTPRTGQTEDSGFQQTYYVLRVSFLIF